MITFRPYVVRSLILLLIIGAISCKKSEELLPDTIPEPKTLSQFSIIAANRGYDTALIKWTPSVLSGDTMKVRYFLSINNQPSVNTDTVTSYVFRNLQQSESYSGKITAYVQGVDSISISFSLNTYNGVLVLARTDQSRNQNVVEAYDVFSGALLWSTKIHDYVNCYISEPVISNDTVFVAENSAAPKLVHALSLTTGRLIYSSLPGEANASLGYMTYANGKLYSVHSTSLIAINSKTGATEWTKSGDTPLGFEGNAVIDGNTLYIPTITGVQGVPFKLYALDASTGNTKWTFTFDGELIRRVHLENGRIYFCTTTDVYCLNADGTLRWKRSKAADFMFSDDLCFVNGKMFAYGYGYYGIYALDKENGSTIWNYPTPGYLASNVTGDNNNIYFIGIASGYTNNRITALDPATGNQIWSQSCNYMFSFYAAGRIYCRSNFQSDAGVYSPVDGSLITTLANPGNLYTDIPRFTVKIGEQPYYLPFNGNAP